jgi:hypothetical protein
MPARHCCPYMSPGRCVLLLRRHAALSPIHIRAYIITLVYNQNRTSLQVDTTWLRPTTLIRRRSLTARSAHCPEHTTSTCGTASARRSSYGARALAHRTLSFCFQQSLQGPLNTAELHAWIGAEPRSFAASGSATCIPARGRSTRVARSTSRVRCAPMTS